MNTERLVKISNNINRDNINYRIKFIETLLERVNLTPLINYDDKFVGGNGFSDNDEESYNSYDTRKSLNKKKHDLKDIIKNLGGTLSYIKSGSTGHTFRGNYRDDNNNILYSYAIKVSAYTFKNKYGDIYDTRRPENAELMMIKLLSRFVTEKKTPHIMLPIGTFDTSINHFVDAFENGDFNDENGELDEKKYEKFIEFVENFKQKKFHDNVSILISEWANRGDFLDFIRKKYKCLSPIHWKVFFFQIISTLAIIQRKYPSFRHNDLKANNILISKINDNVKKKYSYKVCGDNYSVDNIGYQLKLWDFDFACIPGVINNKKVSYSKWNKEINVTPEQNRYYDIHYFFNTLMNKSFFPQIIDSNVVPLETKEFVESIIPKKYRFSSDNSNISKRGRIMVNDEYLTPIDILKNNPYFDEFREKKVSNNKKKKEYININNFLIGDSNILSVHPKIRDTEKKKKSKLKRSKSKKSKSKRSKSKRTKKSKEKKKSKLKNNKKSKEKNSKKKKFDINDLINM
jgi:hypothetical protein